MKIVQSIAGAARKLGFFKSAYANTTHGSNSIQPISKVEVAVAHDHHANLEQLESVYDKLREVAEEYRSFFRNEQELENAFRHVEGDHRAFIDHLVEFLTIYNSTLDTLMEFDKHFGTHHHNVIKALVEAYVDDLESVHIKIEPDGILHYVKSRLLAAYATDPHQFDFLIQNPGLTKLLLRKFRSVKAIILDESDDKVLPSDMQGVIIDRKC